MQYTLLIPVPQDVRGTSSLAIYRTLAETGGFFFQLVPEIRVPKAVGTGTLQPLKGALVVSGFAVELTTLPRKAGRIVAFKAKSPKACVSTEPDCSREEPPRVCASGLQFDGLHSVLYPENPLPLNSGIYLQSYY